MDVRSKDKRILLSIHLDNNFADDKDFQIKRNLSWKADLEDFSQ